MYEMYSGAARGRLLETAGRFLRERGLRMEDTPDFTLLLTEGGSVVATGSLSGNVLKYIAVAKEAEGEGACAKIVSELVNEAFRRGADPLFLYTKPENLRLFGSLGFYALAATDDMAVMENRKNGLDNFLGNIPRRCGARAAVVMNADPFTLGHLYLLERASELADWLYVFVVSEDKGMFPAGDRLEMVRRGAAHIKNALVLPTGPYMVSCATFPAYFIKDALRAEDARAELDVELFASRIAPALGITLRAVGSEPFCPVTASYNRLMAAELPKRGIRFAEFARKDGISAGTVRKILREGGDIRSLVPETTYEYIGNRAFPDT